MDENDLKRHFSALDIPDPSAQAERDAILGAIAEFRRADQPNENNLQGFSSPARRMGRTTFREELMSLLSGKHKASLAVASFAIVAVGVSVALSVHRLPQTTALTSTMAPAAPLATTRDAVSVADSMMGVEAAKRAVSGSQVPAGQAEPMPSEGNPGTPPLPAPMAEKNKSDGNGIMLEKREMAFPNARAVGASGQPPRFDKESSYGQEMDNAYALVIPPQEHRDAYPHKETNPVHQVAEEPVSTFSIDTDTASYANVRRMLNGGELPPADAVRIEEMVNYFDYDYKLPASKETPFEPNIAVIPDPWNKDKRLVQIGIKGYEIAQQQKPRSNLVFLIDTSGSMDEPDRLPLLKNAFKLLVNELGADDTVSIVTYAGSAGTVLEPTKGSNKAKILAALDHLAAGGSTAGAEGIERAYGLAKTHYDKEGVNRVILATDGDFNVGPSSPEALKSLIEEKRKGGIFLSVLGFGTDNYHDTTMQELAQNGNGNAAYIDNLNEARKVLVEEAGSTLFTIAKDVKIQVEFNPSQVSEYRLIGYETRMLKREDFNNDKVDAGDVGAGHAVTALYEITMKGAKQSVDPLRYGAKEETVEKAPLPSGGKELAFLKLRYKLPTEDKSRLIVRPVTEADAYPTLEAAPADTRFATAVAGYGLLLKHDAGMDRGFGFKEVEKLGRGAKGEDRFGYRAEFLNLTRLAASLTK